MMHKRYILCEENAFWKYMHFFNEQSNMFTIFENNYKKCIG
jgi:hypothetical protein